MIPAGVSKRTNKPYSEFYVCQSCNTPQRPEKGFQKAVGAAADRIADAVVIERLDKINKKLDQVIYLITGISAENNKEEFKTIMENVFGKGLIGR